jgi:hypothetical protein
MNSCTTKTQNKNSNSKWSKTAIIGFILSIPGLPLGLSSLGILPVLSIILGVISIRKINRSNGKLKGKGFSIASIILGGIGLILPLWILSAVLLTKLSHLLGNG